MNEGNINLVSKEMFLIPETTDAKFFLLSVLIFGQCEGDRYLDSPMGTITNLEGLRLIVFKITKTLIAKKFSQAECLKSGANPIKKI